MGASAVLPAIVSAAMVVVLLRRARGQSSAAAFTGENWECERVEWEVSVRERSGRGGPFIAEVGCTMDGAHGGGARVQRHAIGGLGGGIGHGIKCRV
jgi:hypothetical protein